MHLFMNIDKRTWKSCQNLFCSARISLGNPYKIVEPIYTEILTFVPILTFLTTVFCTLLLLKRFADQ